VALDVFVHEVQYQLTSPLAYGLEGVERITGPPRRIHEDEAERMGREAVNPGRVLLEAAGERVDFDMREFWANAFDEFR